MKKIITIIAAGIFFLHAKKTIPNYSKTSLQPREK